MGEQQKVNQADTDLNHVLKARRDKLAELQTAGKDPFQITKYDVTAHSMDIKDNYEQWEGKEAAIAGRMMFKRVMGKASFCNVQDLKGSIQSMWQGTAWVRSLIRISRKWTSAISWGKGEGLYHQDR